MTKIIRVIKVEFDNMENRDPLIRNLIGTFIDDEKLSSFSKASKCINNLPAENRYLGWDGKVYPEYILQYEQVK